MIVSWSLRFGAILSAVVMALGGLLPVSAQATPLGVVANTVGAAPLLGTWQIAEPDGGTLFAILRSGGSASRFDGDSLSSEIVRGQWEYDGERLRVRWADGGEHVFRSVEPGFEVSYHRQAGAQAVYTVRTEKLPADHLGTWAAEPRPRGGAPRPAEEEEIGFFGNWEVSPENGEVYFIIVENDRSAATNWTPEGTDREGMRGMWVRQGSELHITWGNGRYTIIQPLERQFGVVHFAPGAVLDGERATPVSARRVRDAVLPDRWGARYAAEREAGVRSIAFPRRRDALNFFRGDWLVNRPDFGFERISLGRFGGVSTTRNSRLRGDWRLGAQELYLNWDDGMRQIILPVGDAFVLMEYAPGRPIDAVPSRIFAATPEDPRKLRQFEEARREAHREFIADMGEAGIERGGEQRSLVPGWLWPFGRERRSEFPEDSFVIEPVRRSSDPWWWPFWSEQDARAEQAEAEATVDEPVIAEVEASENADSETEAAEADAPEPTVSSQAEHREQRRDQRWLPTY